MTAAAGGGGGTERDGIFFFFLWDSVNIKLIVIVIFWFHRNLRFHSESIPPLQKKHPFKTFIAQNNIDNEVFNWWKGIDIGRRG